MKIAVLLVFLLSIAACSIAPAENVISSEHIELDVAPEGLVYFVLEVESDERKIACVAAATSLIEIFPTVALLRARPNEGIPFTIGYKDERGVPQVSCNIIPLDDNNGLLLTNWRITIYNKANTQQTLRLQNDQTVAIAAGSTITIVRPRLSLSQ